MPRIPETGKSKGAVLAHGEGVGLLLLWSENLPLIKAFCGNYAAAPALERFAPCRLNGDGLGLGVERGETLEVGEALGEKGTRPQRISSSSRTAPLRLLRITGWKVVGATL